MRLISAGSLVRAQSGPRRRRRRVTTSKRYIAESDLTQIGDRTRLASFVGRPLRLPIYETATGTVALQFLILASAPRHHPTDQQSKGRAEAVDHHVAERCRPRWHKGLMEFVRCS